MSPPTPIELSAVATVRNPWRRLRPAEWIALAFTAYMLLRWALQPTTFGGNGLPRMDLVATLLVVVTARQAWRYRTLAWPEDSGFARAHWLLFPFALLPLVIAGIYFLGPGRMVEDGGVSFWRSPLQLIWLVQSLAGPGTPFLLLWLTLGIHLKERDRFEVLPFLRESGVGLVKGLRAWAPPMVLIFFYSALRGVLDKGDFPDQDVLLAHLDWLLFLGHDPHRLLEAVTVPAVTEWMAFSYVWYAALYAVGFGFTYAFCSAQAFEELATAVTGVLAVGFFTYTFVPAQGPMFTQHFAVKLDGYYLQWAVDQLMNKYRVPRDCFPSLHTAVSLTFLLAAWRRLRPLFWANLPMVATIPFACVYLRYHYVVDVLAGVLLAVIADRLAVRAVAAWDRHPTLISEGER